MQATLIQKALKAQLQCYPAQRLIVACSGGVDSLVLLYEIASLVNAQRIKNNIIVCYVDHGLSEHAVTWHNFVQAQCLQLALPFVGKKVSLDKNSSQSLEAQARNARYCALKEVAGENGVVLTAHHQDDQVETFFLALKRGSGIKGLAAMAVHSTLLTAKGSLPLVRPLLTIRRKTIEERAKALGLEWVEDESNLDQQFDRNFLRQTVVPMLSQRWSGIEQAITRTVEHCQDAQQLLDEVASAELQQCLTQDKHLCVTKLLALSASRFNYVLRYYLGQHDLLMPSSDVLSQVKQQLFANSDKTPQVKVGTKWLRRFQNKLILTDDFADLSHWQHSIAITNIRHEPISVLLPDNMGTLIFSLLEKNQTPVPSANITCLVLPETLTELTIAFSHTNPVCLPDYRQHSRVLKKVLQELEIAPWQRKRIPLLFEQGKLVGALGQFICQPYSVKHASVAKGIIKINVNWLAGDNSG